jgi:hypothetical protein
MQQSLVRQSPVQYFKFESKAKESKVFADATIAGANNRRCKIGK